ncbi:hypothetical protein WA1_08335 [Scytonema hofmannii PCC 7110]|uniref:Uncharacterized protein n=1 Tax=Scytonema hofmannii PCC 7110 TaxID=128403 RepID=A0A139WRU9_9CYAN|nr:hypothetical protein [Scytonema hofmannii]KYC35160.1 hypothetical protein WA1_08335 [Scytonema hofmannii PCC 7110]
MQSIQSSTHNHKDNFLGLEEEIQFLGVQYLRNFLGQKTAVLIDLKEHGDLWANVEEEIDIPVTVQFLVDEQGGKLMVLLNFEQHGEIWEDIYYSLIVDRRANEPTLPFSEVKKSLIEQGKLSE